MRISAELAALRAHGDRTLRLLDRSRSTLAACVEAVAAFNAVPNDLGFEISIAAGAVADLLDELERLGLEPARFAEALDALDRAGVDLHGLPPAVVASAAGAGALGRFATPGMVLDHVADAIAADVERARRDGDVAHVADLTVGLQGPLLLALVRRHPTLVGSTDGVPGRARDAANRVELRHEVGRMSAELDELDRAIADRPVTPAADLQRRRLVERRDGLEEVMDRLGQVGDDHQLLHLDVGAGRIVVADGDVDTAGHVSTLVPGTGTDLTNIERQWNNAANLREAAEGLGRGDVAVVAWLGYDAPPGLGAATSPGRAIDAAPDLASFTDGVAAVNPDATRTVLGHSYGSTVLGATARKHDLDVDAIVGYGSPGMRVDHADEFRLPDDTVVYATSDTSGGKLNVFSGDQIHTVSDGVLTSRLGPDPLHDGFGAETFDTSDAGGHGSASYLRPDSGSIHGFAQVVVGGTRGGVR